MEFVAVHGIVRHRDVTDPSPSPDPETLRVPDDGVGGSDGNDDRRIGPRHRTDGLIVWAIVSIAFLAYIAFGSIEARIWRFGNLRIEPRSVLRVWTLQAETLPSVAHQWLLQTLFYVCVVTVIVGTLAGTWLLLDEAGTGLSKTSTDDPDRHSPS